MLSRQVKAKKKVKVPVHVTKARRGSRSITPYILNLGTERR
jgi:hypothetical protein